MDRMALCGMLVCWLALMPHGKKSSWTEGELSRQVVSKVAIYWSSEQVSSAGTFCDGNDCSSVTKEMIHGLLKTKSPFREIGDIMTLYTLGGTARPVRQVLSDRHVTTYYDTGI